MKPSVDPPSLEAQKPARPLPSVIGQLVRGAFHIMFWSCAGIILFLGCPRMMEENRMEDQSNCQQHLGDVSAVLETYAQEHDGRYPDKWEAQCAVSPTALIYTRVDKSYSLTCPTHHRQ